jgi:hypothetical protein
MKRGTETPVGSTAEKAITAVVDIMAADSMVEAAEGKREV